MLGVALWSCRQRLIPSPLPTGDQGATRATEPGEIGPGSCRIGPEHGGVRKGGAAAAPRPRSGDALIAVMKAADLGDGLDMAANRRLAESWGGAVALPLRVEA